MGLDEFKTPRSDWMEKLEEQAENRGLSIHYSHVAANSHHFKIDGIRTCVIGKTHHTRKSKRGNSYINLNSVEEANWGANPEEIPFTIEDSSELVDIFGIVIDHCSPNGYQAGQDKFLVLTEDILKEIPESGKKDIRITSRGYIHPFGEHVDSWKRIFENLL
jgi:hypothetical protein